MSIRTHAQHLRISHADVDMLGEAKVSALLGQLEQAAVEASAESGYDPARYTAEGRVWLVRRTRLERLHPVGGGDSISIETHVRDFRRARSLRRYEVHRTGGLTGATPTRVATAETDWVYCDVASGRPVSVPDAMKEALFGTAEAPREPRAPKVSPPDGVPDGRWSTVVAPSHLDHMEHVNNAAWADLLEDAALDLFDARGQGLPEMLAENGALRIDTLDLEYLGDARLGHALEVRSWLRSEESSQNRAAHLIQEVRGPSDLQLLVAESRWSWRCRAPVLGAPPLARARDGGPATS